MRRDLLEPVLARHGGRIAKLTGDGAIVEFSSAGAAVGAAIECQRVVAAHEANRVADERIVLRIGLNLGDIEVEPDGDVLGDEVNVAARLEQLAEPGGICISEAVVRGLRSGLPTGIQDLGPRRLKNIAEPVRVYRLLLDGRKATTSWRWPLIPTMAVPLGIVLVVVIGAAAWWWSSHGGPSEASAAAKPSIAVLTFENLSGDDGLNGLAAGMRTDIVRGMSPTRLFAILARGAGSPDRGGDRDPQRIGRDLDADYIVDGTLQSGGPMLHVTARLIDVATGEQLWSEGYDRPFRDPNSIRSELSRRIANAMIITPTGAAFRAAADVARRKPPASLGSNDCVILAIQERQQWGTKEANARSIELAQRAIELDPRSAAGHLQLAWSYHQQIDRGWAASHDEVMARWLEAASTAVTLDPSYPSARVNLGTRYNFVQNYDRALAEFERAIDLAPDNADILYSVATELAFLGRPELAVEAAERAARLNPDGDYRGTLAHAYFFARRFAEAAAAIEAMEDPVGMDNLFAVMTYAQLGRAAEVSRWRSRLEEHLPDYV